MVKRVKMNLHLNLSSTASTADRVWNSTCTVTLGQKFINSKCRIVQTSCGLDQSEHRKITKRVHVANCFASEDIDAGYRDLEQKYNDLDWLLVDSGSTIHVCRDKGKLYNLRRHSTHIKGIVGDAIAISEWVGDWDLTLRDSDGHFRRFTIRNVVYMPNAARDILGTPRLEKSGWWPDLRRKFLFNASFPSLIFPFFRIKNGLKIIPSVRSAVTLKGG